MGANRQVTKWIDHSTGEVVQSEQVYSEKVPTTLFTMLPHPTSHLLFRVKHVKDLHVLLALCEHAEFNTNRVQLSGSRRKEVMGLADVTSSQLSACLARLRLHGIVSGARGEAILNAHVFWKGHTAARAAFLKHSVGAGLFQADSQFDTPPADTPQ